MAERVGNLGYFGLVKETTIGTALTPTDYIPIYKESMDTKLNLVGDTPIFGNKFERFQMLQGQRSHEGSIEVMAEPNTIAKLADMLLLQGTASGAGPYTHPYTLGATTAGYTCDISTGNVVSRYIGVQASGFTPSWDKNEMRANLTISALASFQGREIATISTTTITLKTDYDPVPNKGLVIGDLVRLYKSAGGITLDTTVATVNADGITVTLGASAASFAAGDFIFLRPATPSFTTLTPFLWAKTLIGFGATASAALTAAAYTTQTRLEQGTNWNIMHKFENNAGADRSGGFDPAALVRTVGDITFKAKKFFDTPEDLENFNNLNKSAVVIRHLSGLANQYELRITINHVKTDGKVVPDIQSNNVNYSDIDFMTQYDTTDGQAFDVKVINNLPTV